MHASLGLQPTRLACMQNMMFACTLVRLHQIVKYLTDTVQVGYNIDTLKVQLYETPQDYFRLVLEILLTACVVINLGYEIKGWALTTWAKVRPFTGCCCHLHTHCGCLAADLVIYKA